MTDGIPIIGQRPQVKPLHEHPTIAELIQRVRELEQLNHEQSLRLADLERAAYGEWTKGEYHGAWQITRETISTSRHRHALPRVPLLSKDGLPALDPLGDFVVAAALDDGGDEWTATILVSQGHGFDRLHGEVFRGDTKDAVVKVAGDAVEAYLVEVKGE